MQNVLSFRRNHQKRPPLFTRLAVFSLLALLCTGCSISHAVRVQDRELIGVKTMIEELEESQVLFLGERHDAKAHHELQLEVLKSLQAQGKKIVIGMEMFEKVSQPALDAWSAGKVPERAFRKVYEWSWRNMPWEMYRDILLFARDNGVPVLGLNAPREVVQAVAQNGFAGLTPEQRKELPSDVDATADERYLKLMQSYSPSHGRSGEAFRNIAEAQMLRNMVMARRINEYLEQHPERVMVVIAGGGHARRTGGIPSELGNELRYKVVLPPVPPINEENVTVEDADYLLVEPF